MISFLHKISINEIDKIEYNGDGLLYDLNLYKLGKNLDKFLIINPKFKYFFEYSDEIKKILNDFRFFNLNDGYCYCLMSGVNWLAKIFTKGWDKNFQYLTINVELTPLPDQLDVIFISYFEKNAEQNWQRVLEKAPWAKRVNGVTGIFNAHKRAAELSETEMFYAVDGDAYIVDDWDFKFLPDKEDKICTFVWHAKNPISNLVYGYGGVKLLPKYLILSINNLTSMDFTESVSQLIVNEQISNYTNFDTDEFAAWRSAFRETAKLTIKTINNDKDIKSKDRLSKWMLVDKNINYGDYILLGALAGKEYAEKNIKNAESLSLINDFGWLKNYFKKYE